MTQIIRERIREAAAKTDASLEKAKKQKVEVEVLKELMTAVGLTQKWYDYTVEHKDASNEEIIEAGKEILKKAMIGECKR